MTLFLTSTENNTQQVHQVSVHVTNNVTFPITILDIKFQKLLPPNAKIQPLHPIN